MGEVLEELAGHLPFRLPSRSQPLLRASASELGLTSGPTALTVPAPGLQASPGRAEGGTLPLSSSQTPVGGLSTITRANGQHSFAGRVAMRPGWHWAGLAGLGLGLFASLGLYLGLVRRDPAPAAAARSPEAPVPPSVPSSPPPATLPATSPSASPAATSGSAAAPTGRAATARGPAAIASKTSEKKKEEKPRRVPKAQATPLLD